jgi:hypothetical protein
LTLNIADFAGLPGITPIHPSMRTAQPWRPSVH